MRNANPQQQPAPSELMLRPQNSILKKPSADGATRTGGPAAPPNPAHRASQENVFPGSPNQSNFPGQTTGQSSMATGRPQTNCRAMGDMEPAQRQGSFHQHGQKQPHGVLEQNGQMQRQGSFHQHGQKQPHGVLEQNGQMQRQGSFQQHSQKQPHGVLEQNGQMQRQGSFHQHGQKQPHGVLEQNGQMQRQGSFQQHGQMGGSAYNMSAGSMYGPGNGSMGPGGMGGDMGGSMYGPGNGSMGPGGMGGGMGGSMYGPGNGSMGPGGMGGGMGGSMYGPGNGSMGPGGMGGDMGGSMYGPGNGSMGPGGMGGGMGGSMYGPGNGSMGPGGMGGDMGGSMYGPGNGSMGPGGMGGGMGGSMYGPGNGSMGPGGMGGDMGGSMYGPGNGSMGPGGMGGDMGGSMYGPGNGSMGPGGMGGDMGGSMYGPAYDGMSRGQSVTAHWNNLNNMSLMNMRDEGGMYGANSRCNINALCPNIASADDHVQLKRSGKRGGRTTEAVSKGENGKLMATGTTVAPLIMRKTSFSKKEEPKTTAKVPANYNIHSLILLDKEGDASKTMKVSVKDPNTLLLKRDDGKDETFENDECILRDKMTSSVNSVLLMDLQENWIAGHTTGLLVGGGKDRGDACVELVKQFLTQCLEKAEKNRKDNSIDFDVTVTLGAVESSDRIRDLLNPDSRSYEKMQLGSSPVSGPCLCGMTTKTVNSSKECVKVVDEGVGRSDNKKHLIVAFFLLKQIKKSSGEKDVYLSSLCMGIAREEVSHLNGLREKSKSEPCTLFRYAIGGASVTVNALVLSGRDSEMRGCLELGRKMREIKNTPPRSGNVKRCVEGTKKEISRQKDKMDKMGDTEKKSTERIVTNMENMVKDCEEMLSKPETTKPKGYPMGGGR